MEYKKFRVTFFRIGHRTQSAQTVLSAKSLDAVESEFYKIFKRKKFTFQKAYQLPVADLSK